MYPILLFDGDCAFCTASANFLKRRIRPRADIIACQHADLDALGVTPRQCQESIQWLASPGVPTVSRGRAIAAVLGSGSLPWQLVGRLLTAPGMRFLADAAYGLVARNRFRLPGSTPACRLPASDAAPMPAA